jgi:NADH dehydrogenase FAD-containing subunit
MKATGRLLLLGGSPPHLAVLEALARGRLSAGEVTVVAPHALQLCPGMVAGYLSGQYEPEEMTVDLRALARRAGGQFREAAVERIDCAARRVLLDDATSLPYDVASIGLEASPAGEETPGARANARFITPLDRVAELRARLDRTADATGPEPLQVVVVSAGATGVEVALAVRNRLDRAGASRAIVSLLDSSHTALRDGSPATQEEAERVLRQGEITLRLSTGVGEVAPSHIRITGGRILPTDLVIWATGIGAPPVFRTSGLPTDARGFLVVEDTLTVAGCPSLFGAGDAVSLASHPRAPKTGVNSLRQGRLLADNLAVALRGNPEGGTASLKRYAPHTRSVSLLDTGDGRAIFSWAGLAVTARWARRLKSLIDRRSVRRFQRLAEGAAPLSAT